MDVKPGALPDTIDARSFYEGYMGGMIYWREQYKYYWQRIEVVQPCHPLVMGLSCLQLEDIGLFPKGLHQCNIWFDNPYRIYYLSSLMALNNDVFDGTVMNRLLKNVIAAIYGTGIHPSFKGKEIKIDLQTDKPVSDTDKKSSKKK